MGNAGCCKSKPKTIENEDVTESKRESHVAPPGNSAYQVDYIPPTNVNFVMPQGENISVGSKNPISPASIETNNKLKPDDRISGIGEVREGEVGMNNVFR